jgi:hypothetical protein
MTISPLYRLHQNNEVARQWFVAKIARNGKSERLGGSHAQSSHHRLRGLRRRSLVAGKHWR